MALQNIGIEAEGFFFSHKRDLQDTEFIRHIYVPKTNSNLFASLKNKSHIHKAMVKFFSTAEYNDFKFYLRYTGSSKPMHIWATKFKKRYVIEHITKELDELALYKPEKGSGFISRILGYSEFLWVPMFLEWRYGASIRGKAIAGVCNSQDIADYQKAKAKSHYNTVIGGDAVNPSEFTLLAPNKLDKKLNLIFLKGSSSRYDYNGIDRVIEGIAMYNGDFEINFEIYGRHLELEKELVEKYRVDHKVLLGRFLDKAKQQEVFSRMHLGVSALAVHRKGLYSTTTIKSREYSALGLPFIYAYDDPDFGTSTAEFALKLDASDAPVDFEKIIEWRKALDDKMNTVVQQMRSFAEEHLSYQSKMLKIKNLIKNS